jgi:Zn-dependent protease
MGLPLPHNENRKEKAMLISILLGSGDIKTKLIFLAIYLIAIVISLSLHEWAHAYAAHKNGDDTALMMGRMTINPLAHLDPLGFAMLLFVGFGWAKPVPVNPRNYTNYRRGEFIVSFAGIFMNLMLALFAALVSTLLAASDLRAMGLEATYRNVLAQSYGYMGMKVPLFIYDFFYVLGVINCGLAVFNLIPVYPLDGSHIFDLLFAKTLGAKAVLWLHRNGRYILYGILILSIVLSRTVGFSIIGDAASWIYSQFSALFARIMGAIF